MKRIISAAAACTILLSATACGDGTPQAAPENTYRTGLASYTHTNDTYGYTEGKNGQSAVSTTYVAAVFDKDGKIVKVMIDEVESRTAFDAQGQLAGYTGAEIISKKELGDNYGMKAASSIGKEWYEQVETLEKWLVGKNVSMLAAGGTDMLPTAPETDEALPDSSNAQNSTGNTGNTIPDTSVSGSTVADNITDGVNSAIDNMPGNGSGSTGWMDEDLRAGVTIDTTYMIKAVEKAYRNAK